MQKPDSDSDEDDSDDDDSDDDDDDSDEEVRPEILNLHGMRFSSCM